MTMNLRGKVSWFGGPEDKGVKPDEELAFISDESQAPHLFLSYQPEGTTGLARKLNPEEYYIACRWDYDKYPKSTLLDEMALVHAPSTGKSIKLYPADWGPHEDTDRIADISPAAMNALGIETDDVVEVLFPYTSRGIQPIPFDRIAISSGHGLYVRGASGILDEVNEARRVVERVADILKNRGVEIHVFHDDVSRTQNENLHRIVDWHNSQARELDVSVHFNAYVETTGPMGTECLYVTQETLASHMASAIAECGFTNRGPKKRTDLFFLNQTMMPSILIEVCFVDSSADADIYESDFNEVCKAIGSVLGGVDEEISKLNRGEE